MSIRVEPKSEDDFSSDVRVLAAIYEYTEVKKKRIWSPTIIEHFEGKLSVDSVFASLTRLHDQAVIGTEFGSIEERRALCVFIRRGHGNIPYAKKFYEMIKKVKETNNTTSS